SRYADSDVYIVLLGLLNDSMPTPGATRFGFAAESINVGPRELNAAIVSSARSVVPMWLEAPTVITHGALPGAPMPPYTVWPAASRPLLPAAATTTMPADTTCFAASVSGSSLYDSVTPAATDRLTTRMLSASLWLTT